MRTLKVCLLGAFAVGKTSLIRRFVTNTFSEKYKTTLGVRIDKKELDLGSFRVRLVIWDVHGEDRFQHIEPLYLKGASALLFVADPTRPETVGMVSELQGRSRSVLGELPFLVLLNKTDLRGAWLPEAIENAQTHHRQDDLREVSARTGDGVEPAFDELARRAVGAVHA